MLPHNNSTCYIVGTPIQEPTFVYILSWFAAILFSVVFLSYFFKAAASFTDIWGRGQNFFDHLVRFLAILLLGLSSGVMTARFWSQVIDPIFQDVASARNVFWELACFSLCYNLGVAFALSYFSRIIKPHVTYWLVPVFFGAVGISVFGLAANMLQKGDIVNARWVDLGNSFVNFLCLFISIKYFGKGQIIYSREQREIIASISLLVFREFCSIVVRLFIAIEVEIALRDVEQFLIDAFIAVLIYLLLEGFPLLVILGVIWTSYHSTPNRTRFGRFVAQFNWRKYCMLFALYLVIFLLFSWGAHQTCFSSLNNSLGLPAILARGSARSLSFLSPLLVLPALENIITKFLRISLGSALPIAHLDNLHRHTAFWTTALMLTHIVSHIVIYFDKSGLQVANIAPSQLLFPWLTGFTATFGALLSFSSGVGHYIRNKPPPFAKAFEVFLWLHQIGTVLFLLSLSIHGAFQVLGQFPISWIPILIASVLLSIDYVLRIRSHKTVQVTIRNQPLHNSFVVIDCTPYSCSPGDYVRLYSSAVAKYEKHPFTVAAIIPNGIRLLIYKEGDWTAQFIANPPNQLQIEGPFASPLSRALHAGIDGFILCATGVGVTTAVSVLTHLVNLGALARPWYLIFSTRDTSLVDFVQDQIGNNFPHGSKLYWTHDALPFPASAVVFSDKVTGRFEEHTIASDLLTFARNANGGNGLKTYHIFFCGRGGKDKVEFASHVVAPFKEFTFEFHREHF